MGLLFADQIFGPFRISAGTNLAISFEAETAQGPMGGTIQSHAGFPGSAVTLANIARKTSGSHIVPTVNATTAAGLNMVNREFVSVVTAVLTRVSISLENIAPGQGQLPIRNSNELPQSDHSGTHLIWPQQGRWVVFKPLSLAFQQHHHRSPPSGDVERLVGGIQNENMAHASPLGKPNPNQGLAGWWCASSQGLPDLPLARPQWR
jgi:hypothetical protein